VKIADLILILNHLQQLYLAAGAKTPAEDLKVFTDALGPHANVPVNQFVSAVRDGLAKQMTVLKPPRRTRGLRTPKTKVWNAASIDTQVKLLRASGTDRSAFENAFANLKSAKHLTLSELAEIARQYAHTVTKYKSKASALDDISKAFVRQARFENKLR
jgi:hypothetical protein